MNPPAGVRITTLLMYVLIVVGLVVLFTQPLPPMPNNMPAGMVGVVKVFALVMSVIEAAIVYLYSRGHNWARWLVIVDSAWQVLLLLRVGKAWSASHVSASLVIVNGLLAVYLLVYLFGAEAKAYFKASV